MVAVIVFDQVRDARTLSVAPPAAGRLSPTEIGLGLRLAVLGEIDQRPLPQDLHSALHAAAHQGVSAAQALLDWRDTRLLEEIERMEDDHGAQ